MKFISSNYDSTKGESEVVIQHLGKKFTGRAKIHASEKDKESRYAGCYYAELKATIKALKYERKLAKVKADMALDFVKSLECYKNFDKESPSAKVVYRQLNQRIKKVNDLADEINYYLGELQDSIKRRDVIIKVIKNKRESKKINP